MFCRDNFKIVVYELIHKDKCYTDCQGTFPCTIDISKKAFFFFVFLIYTLSVRFYDILLQSFDHRQFVPLPRLTPNFPRSHTDHCRGWLGAGGRRCTDVVLCDAAARHARHVRHARHERACHTRQESPNLTSSISTNCARLDDLWKRRH